MANDNKQSAYPASPLEGTIGPELAGVVRLCFLGIGLGMIGNALQMSGNALQAVAPGQPSMQANTPAAPMMSAPRMAAPAPSKV